MCALLHNHCVATCRHIVWHFIPPSSLVPRFDTAWERGYSSSSQSVCAGSCTHTHAHARTHARMHIANEHAHFTGTMWRYFMMYKSFAHSQARLKHVGNHQGNLTDCSPKCLCSSDCLARCWCDCKSYCIQHRSDTPQGEKGTIVLNACLAWGARSNIEDSLADALLLCSVGAARRQYTQLNACSL